MTQIKLKSSIDSAQMAFLLHLFSTWHIEAEVAEGQVAKQETTGTASLFDAFGMWKDRDIDAKKLRRETWTMDRYAKKYEIA
ncbi:hypothetical protein FACS189434_14430 [Bacteroidia bacterium]|nr:hypothetical protein FACS189434_14430 [Bacteroidia bacterium]